jgi:hypothetical protein
MIRLLIKGTKAQAEAAAASRNIPFTFHTDFPTTISYSDIITVGLTSSTYRSQVTKWFCEPAEAAPYSPGTCLYYFEEST